MQICFLKMSIHQVDLRPFTAIGIDPLLVGGENFFQYYFQIHGIQYSDLEYGRKPVSAHCQGIGRPPKV